MSDEYEHDDHEPEADDSRDVATAVEYGEKIEACQMTARKVQAARRLIELAGGYKEAAVLMDAVWFADRDPFDVAAVGAGHADDDAEPNVDAWVAKARRVMAAEHLLQVASGYAEAFVLLDVIAFVLFGEEGIQQVLKLRAAAAGYHDRVAAALQRRAAGE